MTRTPKAATYADLVRQGRAAGMTVRTARAHARKILGARDIIIVGPDGKERPAAGGPSIFKARRRARKRNSEGSK